MQIYFGCGTCELCTARRTREWSDRLFLHYSSLPQGKQYAVFFTLTFAPEFLPQTYSVSRRDVTLFVKQVRNLLRFAPDAVAPSGDKKIKYYMCGEYCPTTSRPHYHGVMFGLRNCQETKDIIHRAWSKGDTDCQIYSPDTGFYTAGYVQKKLYGRVNKKWYKDQGRIPPFSQMSKHLAYNYIMQNTDKLLSTLTYQALGKVHMLTRYMRKLLNVPKELIYTKIDQYIQQDFIEARMVGIEPLHQVHHMRFERYKPPTKEELAAIDFNDLDRRIRHGKVHGNYCVTDAFIDLLYRKIDETRYTIQQRIKDWRTKLCQEQERKAQIRLMLHPELGLS